MHTHKSLKWIQTVNVKREGMGASSWCLPACSVSGHLLCDASLDLVLSQWIGHGNIWLPLMLITFPSCSWVIMIERWSRLRCHWWLWCLPSWAECPVWELSNVANAYKTSEVKRHVGMQGKWQSKYSQLYSILVNYNTWYFNTAACNSSLKEGFLGLRHVCVSTALCCLGFVPRRSPILEQDCNPIHPFVLYLLGVWSRLQLAWAKGLQLSCLLPLRSCTWSHGKYDGEGNDGDDNGDDMVGKCEREWWGGGHRSKKSGCKKVLPRM